MRTQLLLYGKPLLVALLLCWLGITALRNVRRIEAFYNPLPLWDYWRVVEDYPLIRSGHLGPLWKQHNEHRIVAPELIFLTDMALWHGRMLLPTVLSFVCYSGTWLLFWYAVARHIRRLPWAALTAGILAGVLVLWEGSALVISVPFLFVWTLQLFGVAGAVTFLYLSRSGTWKYLALSVLLATAATYSEGNGLFVWPLLLGIATVLRIGRRVIAIVGVAAAVNVGAYFFGYRSSGSLHVRELLLQPVHTLCFVASYLSMPLSASAQTPAVGFCFGFLLLAGTVVCAIVAIRRDLWDRLPFIVLFSFIVFVTLSALLIAAGRMDPTDAGYGSAKALRYLAVPQLTWGAFLLLSFWTLAAASRPIYFWITACLVAAGLVFYLPKLMPWVETNSQPIMEEQLATLSIENNVLDPELAYAHVYPDLHVLQSLLPELRRLNKSIYYHGRDRWLGHKAAEFGPERPEINGAVTAAYPMKTGLQVTGWADDAHFRKRFTRMLLTDDTGRIIGFGRRFQAGFPISAMSPQTPASLAWAAYIPVAYAGRSVHAYVIDARRFGLMPIPQPFRIPTVSFVARPEQDLVLSDVQWSREIRGGNQQDTPPDPNLKNRPAGREAGTYAGADSSTGVIRSSIFAAPRDHCVVIPVLTGPRAGGISTVLKDAQTGSSLETLPVRDSRNGWHYWKVQIRPDVKNLQIIAEDSGRDWGEWVAVASPYACGK